MNKQECILLTADKGMFLTDGKIFKRSVYLFKNQSIEDWQEVSEVYVKKIRAKMTPREFILKLMQKGITKSQIETLINSNDQVWAELNYATTISRANPLLDEFCGQFGMTIEDVDEIFGL